MTVIAVENVSKRYRIRQTGYRTLREDLYDLTGRLVHLRRGRQKDDDAGHIWALDDVSFEVEQGERLGIIGRNGSGKTTLLRLLAGITRPTKGKISIKGRIGALIELMAGFHYELTGRENIYLNGVIIGMTRKEVKRKFDEIVAFAGLEEFIDMPIKRYSSGMQVRLGFAVAAFLEPDILLIDEVLAVGDAEFQKKCLGRMEDAAGEGRTVIFVSHNMAAVSALCERGFILDQGALMFIGNTDEAIDQYGQLIETISYSTPLRDRDDRAGNGRLRFTNVSFQSRTGKMTSTLFTGDTVLVLVEYESDYSQPLRNVSVSIPFSNILGQSIFNCWTRVTGQDFQEISPRGRFVLEIPKLPLRAGKHSINLYCEVNGALADWVKEAAVVDVEEGDFFRTGVTPPAGHGYVMVEHSFRYESG